MPRVLHGSGRICMLGELVTLGQNRTGQTNAGFRNAVTRSGGVSDPGGHPEPPSGGVPVYIGTGTDFRNSGSAAEALERISTLSAEQARALARRLAR